MRSAILKSIVSVLGVVWLAGCGDDVVFRDRPLFNDPLPGAGDFLGYYSVSEKQTTCGNCHVGIQAEWETTKHADAYATLEATGTAQDFCRSCHTTNDQGNAIAEASGWNAVKDTIYHDVQCESCHGPGFTHVMNPDAGEPLASLSVTITADELTNCAECHSGSHHPFADEWAQSAHATPVEYVVSRAIDDPVAALDCTPCHTAQGVLEGWGVVDAYLEADAPASESLGITCAVCHDPHGSNNTAQLRFPIDVPSQALNLCMKCHHKRAEPEIEAASLRGPHSPEGPLLLGEGAGWFPDGFQPQTDRIFGTHGSTANPRLCATCHVANFEVTDPESGDHVFSATGHLFLPIPCVDAQGIPTTAQDCAVTERSFAGCTASGCHGTQDVARNVYVTATQRIAGLVADIDALLALPEVAPDADRSDGIFTTADGAWFNARLGELPGTPIHNPFLIEQLLVATITAVENRYGVVVPGPNRASLELQFSH